MIILIFEGLLSWPQNKPLELNKVIKSLSSLCKKVLKKKIYYIIKNNLWKILFFSINSIKSIKIYSKSD